MIGKLMLHGDGASRAWMTGWNWDAKASRALSCGGTSGLRSSATNPEMSSSMESGSPAAARFSLSAETDLVKYLRSTTSKLPLVDESKHLSIFTNFHLQNDLKNDYTRIIKEKLNRKQCDLYGTYGVLPGQADDKKARTKEAQAALKAAAEAEQPPTPSDVVMDDESSSGSSDEEEEEDTPADTGIVLPSDDEEADDLVAMAMLVPPPALPPAPSPATTEPTKKKSKKKSGPTTALKTAGPDPASMRVPTKRADAVFSPGIDDDDEEPIVNRKRKEGKEKKKKKNKTGLQSKDTQEINAVSIEDPNPRTAPTNFDTAVAALKGAHSSTL